ncbi:hypothetical protein [Leeuwenhoekiella sp. MAR_2009_132]|uniref:hypothetical protein n=1 Tax=Leeuwenhoekiella sp. MAR_2009_132 TaxID=1392489 RepID=UPI00048AE7E5|nr:hypothetical protein [Leeuwenhoekiella sp. MAR_2009_132]
MRILLLLFIVGLSFVPQLTFAQSEENTETVKQLQIKKEEVVNQEKEALKTEVLAINKRLANNEITEAQASELKKEAAKKHARNIEDKLAIIESQIDLLERNEGVDDVSVFGIFIGKDKLKLGDSSEKEVVYDRRTTSDLVLAIGFNNAIIDGQGLNDSPYKIGGSRFFELGIAWKTRVFDNSNFLRLKYGFSFQFNGLKIDDNQYLVEQGDQTVLEAYPINLDKAKFRMDNLVFPVHFEFGPSTKREGDDYFRYSTKDKFKLGLGGYAGFNLLTIQKLKYEENGEDRKDKFKQNFNTNNFIYGLSGYVALGDVALYVKYDLNTIFKDNPIEQRNISVGLRFDMD